ncbi:MAG TPA: S8 family peptidase [Baekduia sp.]
MPDLPALPFAAPQVRERSKGRGGRATLLGPGPARQAERLGPALRRLTKAFEQGGLTGTGQPAANPEQILVFEVAGELTDFVKAINKIPGLEFLVEAAMERVDPGDDFRAEDYKGKVHPYDRQLYVLASDGTAWRELLTLWERFQNGERMPRHRAPFGHLFSRLENLRPWDDRDRLERTGVLDVWQRELAGAGSALVDFEIELWLRRDPAKRDLAIERVRTELVAQRGVLVSQSVMPDIGYHGVLARAPADKLLDVVARHEVRWLTTEGVRFFHAVGQIAATTDAPAEVQPAVQAGTPPPAAGSARLAVLDGVPLAGHDLLANRIVLDDPEGWEAVTPVARRNHGTAMTSIVLHGDLNDESPSQRQPVYVRPILRDQTPDWVRGDGREELPRDRLAVDVLHEAIARMREGDQAVAPAVRVVVLAVGDTVAQFDRFITPLARLLDWIQYRYNLLVLVSAGNHVGDLVLPADVDLADASELQHEVLCTLQRETGLRRLLSPAESINALTIGAAHDDASNAIADDGRVDPLLSPELPNIGSAMGAGVRRAVKPDILLPGGRQLLTPQPVTKGSERRLSIPATRRPPGVRVASPGVNPGSLDTTTYDTGTSPATGLAGYHAGHLLDELDALRSRYGSQMPGPEFDAVLVKASLVHGAAWGDARTILEAPSIDLGAGTSRDLVARTVGYGRSRPDGVLRCDDHRVTALGAARIGADAAHAYRFPLPSALASSRHRRRITVTLAWLTPINADHRAYRRAHLIAEPGGMPTHLVDRIDVVQHAARRGTVQHDVLEGGQAVPYAPGAAIEFVVSCRADAGELTVDVPYAVLVTLEAPQELRLPIYQQVQLGMQVAVPVPVPVPLPVRS